MAFERITTEQAAQLPPKAHYITTTSGMSGHFAVDVWINPEMGGFQEPYNTGIGRYADHAEACVEAYGLALCEDLPYVLELVPGDPAFDAAEAAMRAREDGPQTRWKHGG